MTAEAVAGLADPDVPPPAALYLDPAAEADAAPPPPMSLWPCALESL